MLLQINCVIIALLLEECGFFNVRVSDQSFADASNIINDYTIITDVYGVSGVCILER